MRAYIQSAHDSHVDEIKYKEGVIVVISDRVVILTDDIVAPSGFTRIPLQVALSFLDRDSVVWNTPNNSSEGRARIKRMRENVVSDLSQRREIKSSPALNGLSASTIRTKKTLVDINRRRRSKQERMERWEDD